MNFKEFNNTDMVQFLAQIGHHPIKKVGANYWYISPLRAPENTPSFKVNSFKGMDRFYDFATGEKGTLTDLCLKIFNISHKELYAHINNHSSFSLFPKPIFTPQDNTNTAEPTNNISAHKILIRPLKNMVLLKYLNERKIRNKTLINTYLKELFLNNANGKWYFMIAFKNDVGGWAVRNKHFKGAISHQSFTHINRCSTTKNILVFEGFLDALSYLEYELAHAECLNEALSTANILVLNSVNNLNKAESLLENYHEIYLFLDNDKTGHEITNTLLMRDTKYKNMQSLYHPCKDFNEWWILQDKT